MKVHCIWNRKDRDTQHNANDVLVFIWRVYVLSVHTYCTHILYLALVSCVHESDEEVWKQGIMSLKHNPGLHQPYIHVYVGGGGRHIKEAVKERTMKKKWQGCTMEQKVCNRKYEDTLWDGKKGGVLFLSVHMYCTSNCSCWVIDSVWGSDEEG